MFWWFHGAIVTRTVETLESKPRTRIQQQLDGRGRIRRVGKTREDKTMYEEHEKVEEQNRDEQKVSFFPP